jgi:hypothetical protein
MEYAPIEGKPVRFPPGRVQIRLTPEHRQGYRALYARYQSILGGLPVLRERDFDGRKVLVSSAQLDALNEAFAKLDNPKAPAPGSVFESQEEARKRLFKRLQYLS